ncbi:GNAT family N-acetyltransferase [Luteimonas kalidii]|uniref:GNAT family N-acetyltransferase n=1 Tax=Luteimonas kalidii TaxID=3042025 RepID=A0ABT6JRW1_9GAMM|nr:GNAT family N-acetyltransferase [Luteimonas kalidii]MDH5833420.1 GNAT family N-acetyltransferase [Luteimonas kalidii]
MSLEVRRAAPDDLAALLELVQAHAAFERARPPAATRAGLDAALFERSAAPAHLLAWIAARGDTAIGYLTATRDFSTWRCAPFLHMDCLYVAEGHRSDGVGASLFAALLDFARDARIDEIQWQTPHWNHRAARFYRRLGATGVGKLRFRYSPPGI